MLIALASTRSRTTSNALPDAVAETFEELRRKLSR
jgi:hypothetical protein